MENNQEKKETLRLKLKKIRRKITYSSFFTYIVSLLAYLIIYIYNKTLKIKVYYHPDFLKIDRTKVCYAFWHGRQFLLNVNFSDWKICIMTDVSWAGEIQTKILKRFGYKIVRGSSKRKGVEALLHMKKAIADGHSGAFAVDGPRGPIYRSKPGILFLSEKLGYPVVPVATTAKNVWIIEKTWCKYIFPKPFSKCMVSIGKPIIFKEEDKKLTSEELDRILLEWTKESDRIILRNSEK